MPRERLTGILLDMGRELGEGGEIQVLLNPLATGFSVVAKLLDVVAPRPKLRTGTSQEFSLSSLEHAGMRKRPGARGDRSFVGLSVAGGEFSGGLSQPVSRS